MTAKVLKFVVREGVTQEGFNGDVNSPPVDTLYGIYIESPVTKLEQRLPIDNVIRAQFQQLFDSNVDVVYTLAEVDQKLNDFNAMVDNKIQAAQEAVTAAFQTQLNELPGKVFSDQQREEMQEVILQALENKLEKLKQELLSELKTTPS